MSKVPPYPHVDRSCDLGMLGYGSVSEAILAP